MPLPDVLQDSIDFNSKPPPSRSSLSRSSLEKLPIDIQILILRSLPDGSALRGLVRSCPSYHASYLSRRHLILSSVLHNDLLPDALFLAFALQETSIIPQLQQDGEDPSRLRLSFLKHFWLHNSTSLTEDWVPDTDLDTLISVFSRHWLIHSVALQYFAEKLPLNPVTGEVIQSYEPPSRDEKHRVYRSLYHFEIYCCLFVSCTLSQDGPFHEEEVWESRTERKLSQTHLPNIDVADVEGLACLREYFFSYYTKLVSSKCKAGLQQLEDSPPEWMPLLEEEPHQYDPNFWEAPYQDQKIEYWLSLGLRFFHRLSQMPTAEAQAQILYQNPWRREHFLSKALKGECRGATICTAHPQGYDHELDSHPILREAAWRETSDRGFVNHARRYLQSWGYIFWDQQRLDAWKMREQEVSRISNRTE